MRHLARKMAVLGVVLGATSLTAVTIAQAQTVGTIGGSPHDLSSLTTVTDEVCVFCHTPHAAVNPNAPAAASVPLWNKTVPAAATFTTYDSTTIDGTILPVGSVSVACLSCHDGSQAMDVVINAPGSRGINPAGAELDALAIGVIGAITGTAADLGKDLSNDHPIGVQYGGFTPAGGTQIDPDFNGGALLQTATINTTQVWWLDTPTGTAGSRDKNDVILYTRDNAGSAQPFVECGSCHDPHQGAGVGTAAGSAVNFMRIANTASNLCVTCHVK